MPDDPKIDVVKVGKRYYLADEWVCAYNTEFMSLFEQRVASAKTDRQLMRAVRQMKNKSLAQTCLQGAVRRVESAGHPLELTFEMRVVARFPSLSDLSAKVVID